MMDETMAADLCEYSDKLWQKSRDRAIDEALEVIDKVQHRASAKGQFWTAEKTIKVLRRDVKALKGGERE